MIPDKKKILWVDDEIDLLKSHIIYLENRNYSVTQATNGPDAIEIVSNETFDLVLLDEQMPVMEGLEVLKKMKDAKPDLPVVMVTKNEAEELMEQAIGSQIDGFLTKPVNPSQILSVLKGILDRRQISEAQLSRTWPSEFAEISQLIDSDLDADGWIELHNKLCSWEIKLDRMGDEDLIEMVREARLEADRQFGRWVERAYPDWIKMDPDSRPPLSNDLINSWLVPLLQLDKPTLFLVVDCLRLDQWMAIEPVLADHFDIRRDSYFSILPTATPYSRNALFSGWLPSELERVHPDLWTDNDEDEASSNRFEHQFMDELLKRRSIDLKPASKYVKVLQVEEISEFERRVKEYTNIPLTAMVYNFVDILLHSRQTSEVLKEIIPDEAAYRSITSAWFRHSSLYKVLKAYAEAGGSVLVTSDHGSLRGQRGAKVIGDRQTSTSLRYKRGRNLKVDNKYAVRIKEPLKWGLPKQGVNTMYILAREDYFFVYPTNYHKYLDMYKDSFQHGGVSLDEMVLPVVTMTGK